MKALTIRLPEPLVAEVEEEARRRRISKSEVIRERLQAGLSQRKCATSLTAIADLIGSVNGLPSDLSARKKRYLRAERYGQKNTH